MIYAFEDFELDGDALELRHAGQPLKADPLVLRLLIALVRNPGQLVSKQQLLQEVWDGRAVADNVLTVSMARLRRTLGTRGGEREFVSNVHGRGYRFMLPVRLREGALAPLVAGASAPEPGRRFVGRVRVLERLRSALREARAGHGSAVALSGEPGIGKTRAMEELAHEAGQSGALVAFGFCREAGDAPALWPLAQLARALIAQLPADEWRTRLGTAAGQLARLLPELEDAPRDERGGSLDNPVLDAGRKHRLFDAIMRLFALAAEQTPCVLLIDDAHRADAATLEFLRCYIDEITRTHVLLLLSLRKNEQPPAPGAAHLTFVLGHRNCERIALERLAAEDVAAYVAAELGADPQGALAHAVFDKSEGNPFFMVELSRQLRDQPLVDPSRPHAAQDIAELRLPGAALEIVRQHLALLDDDARGVLSCAAVLGRHFELTLLQAVSGRAPSALMTSLDAALASEVVVAARGSRTAFGFGHELLRAALYDAIPAAERRALHLRCGEALEQRRQAGDTAPAAELAYHYHAALPHAELRKTVDHCLEAARAADHVRASSDVVRHVSHALEALDLMPNASAQLRMNLLSLKALHARVYSVAESERVLNELNRVAREQGAGAQLAFCGLLLDANPGFPPMAGARAALEDALRLLPHEMRGLRAAVIARLATSAPLAYDAAQSGEEVARALEVACRDGFLLGEFAARAAELYLLGGPAHRAGAGAREQAFERMCQEHPERLSIPPVLFDIHRAITAGQHGAFAAMHAALERAAARCRELQNRELLWYVDRCRAMARIDAGECGAGMAELAALHRRAEQEDVFSTDLLVVFDRCVVFGDAGTGVRDGLRRALASGPDDPPNVWALKLRALAAAGLLDETRAGLRAFELVRLAGLPCDRDYLGTLAHLGHAALAVERLDYVEALYALLAPYPSCFALQLSFGCDGAVAQLLGRLAGALGRRADAIAQLEAAIALETRAGLIAPATRSRLELARALQKAGSASDKLRAATLEREARSEAARLGMPVSQAQLPSQQ